MTDGWKAFVGLGASTLGSALVPIWIAGWTRGAARAAANSSEGRISPDRRLMLGLLWVSTATALLFVIGLVFFKLGWYAVLPGLLFIAIAVLSTYALHPSAAVCWSETGLEGPSRLIDARLPLERSLIPWGEIVEAGGSISTWWFVKSRDGRKIYWSTQYSGWPLLAQVLRERRPDLSIPPERR